MMNPTRQFRCLVIVILDVIRVINSSDYTTREQELGYLIDIRKTKHQ